MIFLFSITDAHGVVREQTVSLAKPVLHAPEPMWVCEISWRGPLDGPSKVYGATSLQSLSLAIDLIQTEMASAFRAHSITESGAPWLSTLNPA